MTALERAQTPGVHARALDELRAQFAPDASDTELAFFDSVCRRLGLTPYGEQIVLIGRYDNRLKRKVHRPQVTVAGRRVLADRTGLVLGVDGPMWTGPRNTQGELVWEDVWTGDGYPYAARTLVHRRGCDRPFNGTVKWSEFAQTDRDGALTPMWRSMPSLMLGKCSESLALRRAFPDAIPIDLVPDLEPGEEPELGPVDPEPDEPSAIPAAVVTAASAQLRNELADRLAEVTRRRPSATDELRRRWIDLFSPEPAPVVRAGPYTVQQGLDLDDWLREVEDQQPPPDVYDDDPEAYDGGATRYDPGDGAA